MNDRKLDYGDNASKECTKARYLTQQPDKAEREHFYSSLNKCKVKPVCLSVVEPYARHVFLKHVGYRLLESYLMTNICN